MKGNCWTSGLPGILTRLYLTRVTCARRLVSADAHQEHAWTPGRTNICRLNPINANWKPKRRLLQRNENFSRNLRLIIGCKFAVMPEVTLQWREKRSQGRDWAVIKPSVHRLFNTADSQSLEETHVCASQSFQFDYRLYIVESTYLNGWRIRS